MQIRIPHIQLSLADALRRCGYGFEREHSASQEVSATRQFARGDFPRLHIYAKFVRSADGAGNDLLINLHLDQKKPSYGRHTAHSGEYEGPLIDEELKRIQNILIHEVGRNI